MASTPQGSSTLLSRHAAEVQGYAHYIEFWADRREGFDCPGLAELIEIERKWLREFFDEGPYDDVWEAEFFEALMEFTPVEIDDAAPGTIAAIATLALHGAAVVRSSNAGALEDPPAAENPAVLFFASEEMLERIRNAALRTGLTVETEDRLLWALSGPRLRDFPEFASRLSS